MANVLLARLTSHPFRMYSTLTTASLNVPLLPSTVPAIRCYFLSCAPDRAKSPKGYNFCLSCLQAQRQRPESWAWPRTSLETLLCFMGFFESGAVQPTLSSNSQKSFFLSLLRAGDTGRPTTPSLCYAGDWRPNPGFCVC